MEGKKAVYNMIHLEARESGDLQSQRNEWAHSGSNREPSGYEPGALTT